MGTGKGWTGNFKGQGTEASMGELTISVRAARGAVAYSGLAGMGA